MPVAVRHIDNRENFQPLRVLEIVSNEGGLKSSRLMAALRSGGLGINEDCCLSFFYDN